MPALGSAALLLAIVVGADPGSSTLILEDQWERSHDPRKLLSGTVLVGGDQRRTDESIRAWVEAIRSTLGDVPVVGLVDLGALPFFVPRSAVRSGLRETNPKTTVLCDWDGELTRRLGLPPGGTTVEVYEPGGRRAGRVRGEPTPEALGSLGRLLGPSVTATAARGKKG